MSFQGKIATPPQPGSAATRAFLAGLLLLACGEFKTMAPAPDRSSGGTGGGARGGASGAQPDEGKAGSSGGAGPAQPPSAAGPDANADAPGGTTDPGGAGATCSVGQTRCAMSGAPAVEVCMVGGAWAMQKTCTSICANGECAGSCAPDDKQCGADQKPAICSKDGDWVPGEPCPNVCTGKGECTGDCKPGTAKCGAGPDNLIPYECDDKGKWMAKTACSNLCANGSCGGSCPPTTTRCVGNTPQTCSAMGTWDPGQPCKGQACVAGKCTGVCEPKAVMCGASNNLQTCDANGAWQDGSPCSGKTCVKGACIGSCAPNAPKRCSPDQKATQTCGANGVWMNGDSCADRGCTGDTCNMCKPGSKKCTGNSLQTCNGAGSAWGQDQPCLYKCDATKLVCIDAIPCAPACNGNAHCNQNNTSIITEKCDTTKGQCVVASTVSTCRNGSTCSGAKCSCNCSSNKMCKDDLHVVTMNKCDTTTGDCGENPVETCMDGKKCAAGACSCPPDMMPNPGGKGCVEKCDPPWHICNGSVCTNNDAWACGRGCVKCPDVEGALRLECDGPSLTSIEGTCIVGSCKQSYHRSDDKKSCILDCGGMGQRCCSGDTCSSFDSKCSPDGRRVTVCRPIDPTGCNRWLEGPDCDDGSTIGHRICRVDSGTAHCVPAP